MRLVLDLKTITGHNPGTIEIEHTATVRELRRSIGRFLRDKNYYHGSLEECTNMVGKITLFSPKSEYRARIFIDTPSEVTLNSLFPENTDYSKIKTACFFDALLDPYPHAPTEDNPQGARLYAYRGSDKQTTFFKSVSEPHNHDSFTKRLTRINFTGVIPEKFLDPITQELMDNPKLASDGYVYDSKTLRQLKNSPYTREPLTIVADQLSLQHEISEFVKQCEIREQTSSPRSE